MTRLGSPRRRSDGNSRRALVLAPRTSAKPIGRISNRFIQKRHANERIIHPLSGSPTKSAEANTAPFFPFPITFPSFRRARNSVKFQKTSPTSRKPRRIRPFFRDRPRHKPAMPSNGSRPVRPSSERDRNRPASIAFRRFASSGISSRNARHGRAEEKRLYALIRTQYLHRARPEAESKKYFVLLLSF